MWKELLIKRARAHFTAVLHLTLVSFSALPPWLLIKLFHACELLQYFIQSVTFIDRKCSLDSELLSSVTANAKANKSVLNLYYGLCSVQSKGENSL